MNRTAGTAAVAFFVAVDLVLADGVVAEAEKKFLAELQRTSELDDATVTKSRWC